MACTLEHCLDFFAGFVGWGFGAFEFIRFFEFFPFVNSVSVVGEEFD